MRRMVCPRCASKNTVHLNLILAKRPKSKAPCWTTWRAATRYLTLRSDKLYPKPGKRMESPALAGVLGLLVWTLWMVTVYALIITFSKDHTVRIAVLAIVGGTLGGYLIFWSRKLLRENRYYNRHTYPQKLDMWETGMRCMDCGMIFKTSDSSITKSCC